MRVAVVGCGRMGAERVAAARVCGAQVCAVVDVDSARASTLAADSGSAVHSHVDSLPWRSLDAVFVCTPPASRIEAVRHAARYGVPIFVEKPLAIDGPSAHDLVALVDGSTVNAVGYMNRYRSSIAMARQLARSQPLIGLTLNWSGRRYGVPWWSEEAQSGGPVNEQATHIVDLCRYVGGEVVEVLAIGNDHETRLAAALLLEDGAVATLFYTCEAAEKYINLEVVTSAGHVRLNGWNFTPEVDTADRRLDVDGDSAFLVETRAFLSAAASRNAGSILCDFRDAYRTQTLVDRIREKARSASRSGALAT